MTRGKRLVVVVGRPKALALAVKGSQGRRRWAKLAERLGGEAEAVQRPATAMAG